MDRDKLQALYNYVKLVNPDEVKDRIPEREHKQGTTRLCRRFYALEPKEEGLFHD